MLGFRPNRIEKIGVSVDKRVVNNNRYMKGNHFIVRSFMTVFSWLLMLCSITKLVAIESCRPDYKNAQTAAAFRITQS